MTFWQQVLNAAGPGFPLAVIVFVLAALVLFAIRPAERGRLRAALFLFVLSLIGLLALAIYVGVVGWNMGADDTGGSMSTAGYVAMALGIVVTLALGAGLMALMYYSSKHDRD